MVLQGEHDNKARIRQIKLLSLALGSFDTHHVMEEFTALALNEENLFY